ncbi:hypothetical protein JOC74_000872 [Bacillus capparidis]|uniref:Fur-regulated basic protein FbpC n=1 Tax=Bacillus capparidis TaxID=1840411 RepID=A0ABS4CTE1_9BACI|nr:hypothetical protein [Bacillus capparidis]
MIAFFLSFAVIAYSLLTGLVLKKVSKRTIQ